MHDRRDENDTVRDAEREARSDVDPSARKVTPGRVDDGTGLVPDALGKREVERRREAEREADSGSLGSGIGDDRPGAAAPREGDPEP